MASGRNPYRTPRLMETLNPPIATARPPRSPVVPANNILRVRHLPGTGPSHPIGGGKAPKGGWSQPHPLP
ncbi:hypothetical protein GCM10010208_04180 [Actinomadura livida]|nr:hypothetical protein GCM10010208_04180 [Actinomadura livida]